MGRVLVVYPPADLDAIPDRAPVHGPRPFSGGLEQIEERALGCETVFETRRSASDALENESLGGLIRPGK